MSCYTTEKATATDNPTEKATAFEQYQQYHKAEQMSLEQRFSVTFCSHAVGPFKMLPNVSLPQLFQKNNPPQERRELSETPGVAATLPSLENS